MKFNLGELESLFCDIQDIIDYIEQSNFEGRKFTLFLSNGDKFNYKLNRNHVPHLLGINTDALVASGLFGKQSSFNVLKDFVSNSYKIFNLNSQGVIKYENIFSEYILDKIKVFKNNITPNVYDTEFVCKYESSRGYGITDKNAKYDYIIVKKTKDDDGYAILCLVNNNGIYAAMSSMLFENKEKMQDYLNDYVKNQEITVLSGVNSMGDFGEYMRNYSLKPELIIPKLKNLLDYKKQFNCISDTTGGYIYSLEETVKHKDKHIDSNSLLYELKDLISNGKIVDRSKFMNTNLIELVDAYNDYICNKNINSNDISISYSEICNERDMLKNENYSLNNRVDTLLKELNDCREQLLVIKEENNKYKTNEEEIIKILRPGM